MPQNNVVIGANSPYIFTTPIPIESPRAPSTSDKNYPVGQPWVQTVQSTGARSYFIHLGDGTWDAGGNIPATTVDFGLVKLTDNNEPVATKFYVDAAIAGVVVGAIPPASTTTSGIGKLVSDANAVARIASTPAQAYFVQPSNLTAIMSAPGAIGNTTPSTGAFTTLGFTTMTGTIGGTWASGGTAISIGADASSDNISIGTAGTRALTLGNSTATTSIALNTGTGSSLNLGTNAIAHTVTIGNVTGATAVVINAGTAASSFNTTNGAFNLTTGTGTISLGADAADHTITIGNSTGVTAISLNGGTGGVNVGTNAIAHAVTIGNITTTSSVVVNFGTTGLTMDGVASSVISMFPSNTTGAITIGGTAQSTGVITLGSSSATSTVKIASGAGASTVTICEGTAGANTVSICNSATAATNTVNILCGVGSAGGGALHMADNTRVTAISLANIAPAAARTTSMFGGNSAQSDTVTLWAGNPSAGTQSISIFGGVASGGTQNINLMNGTQSAGTQAVNILSGITTGTAAGTFNLGTAAGIAITTNINTGASAHVLNIGNASSGLQTWTVGAGGLTAVGSAATIQLFNDAAANIVTLGTVTAASQLNLQGAAVAVKTPATGTVAIGLATMTGLITIGQSTAAAGQTVSINSGTSNAGTNIVNILNGTTPAASTTLNIMSTAASAGTQTFNLFASGATRAGVINIATGIAAHAVTIGQVTTTIAINGPTTHTLASGAAVGVTINTASGTGRCLDLTSSAVTVPDLLSNLGGLKVTPVVVTAGGSPQTCSGRHGHVIFSGVSIAASAVQTFTITNTLVTAGSHIMISMYGATTGSAPVIQSYTPGAGTFNVVVMNGAGLTTTTANITFVFWILD